MDKDQSIKIKNKINKGFVLVSVFDKRGIVNFTKKIKALGYEVISTEGTGRKLAKSGITFIPARKVSKNPNKLKDCVKTISFRIEAGILFNRLDQKQVKEAKELSIKPIDIVICNFPPLKKVVKNPEDFNIKNIDVGGPLMVRAAATNFRHVLVVVDPDDYDDVIDNLSKKAIPYEFRKYLAIKAFSYTCFYDQQIIQYLRKYENFLKRQH